MAQHLTLSLSKVAKARRSAVYPSIYRNRRVSSRSTFPTTNSTIKSSGMTLSQGRRGSWRRSREASRRSWRKMTRCTTRSTTRSLTIWGAGFRPWTVSGCIDCSRRRFAFRNLWTSPKWSSLPSGRPWK